MYFSQQKAMLHDNKILSDNKAEFEIRHNVSASFNQHFSKIRQKPGKIDENVYSEDALQQNRLIILQSIKHTQDVILKTKRCLQSIPILNYSKTKIQQLDRANIQNQVYFKNIHSPIYSTNKTPDNKAMFFLSNKNSSLTKEINSQNQHFKLNKKNYQFEKKQANQSQQFTSRQLNYSSPRHGLNKTFQTYSNYSKTPISRKNKLNEQIKYFKKKQKNQQCQIQQKPKYIQLKNQPFSSPKQHQRFSSPKQQKTQKINKKMLLNSNQQQFNKKVNVFMQQNLQINIKYQNNQQQTDTRRKYIQRQQDIQQKQCLPSKQGYVKKAISPLINLRSKHNVQNKQQNKIRKKTFINKQFSSKYGGFKSPRGNQNKLKSFSTLTSPREHKRQPINKKKSENNMLIKEENANKKIQGLKYISKDYFHSDSNNTKFQQHKKTLSEKINEQLSKLQKLNTLQNQLTKRKSIEQRNQIRITSPKNDKVKLKFNRLQSPTSLQNTYQSKQQSPSKSGRKRKLIFQKQSSKIKQQMSQEEVIKNSSKPLKEKDRRTKLYSNQINSHNKSIQAKIYQFLVEEESKSNRSIQKNKGRLNYKRNQQKKYPSAHKNVLTSTKLSSSLQKLGGCPFHGNKSKQKQQMYSSLDKSQVEYILRQQLQIREDKVENKTSKFTKLEQSQIRNQIKKIKEYQFIQRYFNNYQLQEILKQFIKKSIPCRKWVLIIIDEVYKKIRIKQETSRQ